MSKPLAAAVPARRKDNRFDPSDFADVLAPKGQAAGAVTGAEQRGAASAAASGASQLQAEAEGASSPTSAPYVPTLTEAATEAAQRSTAVAQRSIETATEAVQQRRRNSTSFDFPDYVNEGITAWLREHPEHNLKTMIHLALTKLGVHVEPDDLVPQRRRRR